MAGMVERLETIILREDLAESDLDGSLETVVVKLVDEDGIIGIGEADSSEEAVSAIIQRQGGHGWSSSLERIVLGTDPFLSGSTVAKLAQASFWTGPGGVAAHAVSAIDIALHDLAAQQLGRPLFHVLGGARRSYLTPYATCWVPNPSGTLSFTTLLEKTLEQLSAAVAKGFTAVKMELLFGEVASDRNLVESLVEARSTIGPDTKLLVDFGYRWSDWRSAHSVIERASSQDLYLVEAPLSAEDVLGYAKLSARSETRIAGGEAASTLAECRDWLERGHVDVLQPDLARAGGFIGLKRIAQLAELHGATVIPHCWRTGINAAAARHLHAALPNVPMIEFLDPGFSRSELRSSLASPEPKLVDGRFSLPTSPGLGVRLNDDIIDRHRTKV